MDRVGDCSCLKLQLCVVIICFSVQVRPLTDTSFLELQVSYDTEIAMSLIFILFNVICGVTLLSCSQAVLMASFGLTLLYNHQEPELLIQGRMDI